MLKVLLVGIGGFFGAASRYALSGWVQQLLAQSLFPYGTATVNILGCFLIGILGGLAEIRQILTPELRVLLMIGFLGGFTTFSTFGFESVQMMRDGQFLTCAYYVFSQVLFGFSAVWIGFSLIKLI